MLHRVDFNVESNSYFSSSATQREDLKGFVYSAELEREECVKRVSARWLSFGGLALSKIYFLH
jgi:hypothetical protein